MTQRISRLTAPRDEWGTAALEMVVLAPVLIVILLFVVGLGRMAHADQQVQAGAADAARAASLERNTSASAAAAQQAARDSLGQAGVSCTNLDVSVNLDGYEPGGQVRVTLKCTADLSSVAMSGFPGSKVFTSTSTVPIENWRAE